MPTPNNEKLFYGNKADSLLDNDLKNIWDSADFRIANLETPITDCQTKNIKHGRNIKNSPKVMPGIKALNFSVLGCANNHILDYGQKGLEDTIKNLENNKIKYGGIANNLDDYMNFIKLEKDGKKIGVYFCSENNFSSATDKSKGALPFDYYKTIDTISKIKNEVDVLIMLYHAGIEFFPYPAPVIQKNCRAMVRAGADIVVCQHNHRVSCCEEYCDGNIIYGQGHFISCLSEDPRLQDELIIQLNIDDDSITVNYIPVVVNQNHTIKLAGQDESKRILKGFKDRSNALKKGQVKDKYLEFLKVVEINYLLSLRGYRLWDRIMVKLMPNLWKKIYFSKDSLLVLWDYTHSETGAEIIKGIIDQKKDELC